MRLLSITKVQEPAPGSVNSVWNGIIQVKMHAESTRIVAWTGAKTVFQITVLQFVRNSYSQFQWHKSTIPETKVRDKSMKEPICCQFPHSRFKFRKKNRQLFLGTIVDFFSQMTPRPPLRYRGPWPLHPHKKKAIVCPMNCVQQNITPSHKDVAELSS